MEENIIEFIKNFLIYKNFNDEYLTNYFPIFMSKYNNYVYFDIKEEFSEACSDVFPDINTKEHYQDYNILFNIIKDNTNFYFKINNIINDISNFDKREINQINFETYEKLLERLRLHNLENIM